MWDFNEHIDRFVIRPGPAMPVQGGFAGAPEERGAGVVNLQTA